MPTLILRLRRSLRPLLAALALTASFTGARAQDAAATRWSTVDLERYYKVDPQTFETDTALKERIKQDGAAVFKQRAAEAGAELVWDLGGASLIGISPVLYADPALALPAHGPARVLTVDLAKLYDSHVKTHAQNARIQASDKDAQQKVEKMNAAGNALVAEYKKLLERGDEAAAAKKLEQISAKQKEVEAFIRDTRAGLQRDLGVFRAAMLKEISAGVVATARSRGATLVLDTAGPSWLGFSNLVHLDPALRPAVHGGVGEGSAVVAQVRTVDLSRLFDRHPRALAQQAKLEASRQRAQAEVDRMTQAAKALADDYAVLATTGSKAAAEKALDQLTARKREIETFSQNTGASLQQQMKAERDAIFAELTQAAGDVAQRAGAHLLIDTSGTSHLGLSYIVYAAPKLDLTEEIARELKLPPGR